MISDLNSPNEIKKRRYQDSLKLCGSGMVVFAAWSVMKFAMQLIVGEDDFMESIYEQEMIVRVIAYILMSIFLMLESGIRIYIWRCAVREAEGGKTRIRHIVLAVVVLVTEFSLTLKDVLSRDVSTINANYVMELVLSLTDYMVIIGLLIQTVKLRKINRIIAQEG